MPFLFAKEPPVNLVVDADEVDRLVIAAIGRKSYDEYLYLEAGGDPGSIDVDFLFEGDAASIPGFDIVMDETEVRENFARVKVRTYTKRGPGKGRWSASFIISRHDTPQQVAYALATVIVRNVRKAFTAAGVPVEYYAAPPDAERPTA